MNIIATALKRSLRRALAAKVPRGKIVVDPGIGFFREEGEGIGFSRQRLLPWYLWDSHVLNHLRDLRALGYPIGISVSRKSFIGKILDIQEPAGRLPGSLAATALAVANGASLIRTHDVAETLQAVRVAETISRSNEGSLSRHIFNVH
jgi:dihydropteroate synthase